MKNIYRFTQILVIFITFIIISIILIVCKSPTNLNTSLYILDNDSTKDPPVPKPRIRVKMDIYGINYNDDIDIGSAVFDTSKDFTFTVCNTGDANLVLTSTPKINITGSGFVLKKDADTTIDPNGSTTFIVSFYPPSIAVYEANVSIANNCDYYDPFIFNLIGTGTETPAPEINVKLSSHELTSDMAEVQFSRTGWGYSSNDQDFIIENKGSADLEISSITLSSGDTDDFDINTSSMDNIVEPDSSTTFKVTFTPTTLGERTAVLTINNNDDDEDPFNITLKGKGIKSWRTLGSAGFSDGEAKYISLFMYDNLPWVAYQDLGNSSKATVMKYDGNNWNAIGSSGFSAGTASYTSLSVYNGIPYIAFKDGNNSDKVTVMKYNSSWSIEGSAGFSSGEAFSPKIYVYNGTSYVAYSDAGNNNKASLKKYDTDNWITVGVESFSAGKADNLSLFVYNNIPYIAFSDHSNDQKAIVMKYEDSTWDIVGSAGFSDGIIGETTSLYIDNGIPYLAFTDSTYSYKARVMKFDGNDWIPFGETDISSGEAEYVSLFFNNDNPYLAFKDIADFNRINFQYYKDNSWDDSWDGYTQKNIIQSHVNYVSLFFSNGTPYIALSDGDQSYKATVITYK